ncbi:MAG: Hpt domain-containing protein [Planctomycetota bacterium]|nr:Hpt domain-containing protein [Planctomycetota bacterium]MDA1105400.1 Hpt domain-containing protein [Planctomycetota bacterium]
MPLYSRFHDDPDMADLVALFVGELPQRLEVMEESFASNNLPQLHRLAHQLKGAGCGYGFDEVTNVCASIEQATKAMDRTRSRAALDQMRDIVRECRAGAKP